MNLKKLDYKTFGLNKVEDIEVCCVTAKDEPEETILHQSLIRQNDNNLKCRFVTGNKEGLTSVYNRLIESSDKDHIIFVHDDVYIESSSFLEHVTNGFKYYDVCGLAGGSYVKLDSERMLWHMMTKQDSWSGVVNHYNHHKNPPTPQEAVSAPKYPTVFGEIGKSVVLLDGLFLAINIKKIREANVKFDENITGFHHYDLKFCVDSYVKGLKLGTIPVSVTHASPGLRNLSEDFLTSERYFRQYLQDTWKTSS